MPQEGTIFQNSAGCFDYQSQTVSVPLCQVTIKVAPAKAAQPDGVFCVQQGIPPSHTCSEYGVPQTTSPVQPGLPSQK